MKAIKPKKKPSPRKSGKRSLKKVKSVPGGTSGVDIVDESSAYEMPLCWMGYGY